MERAEADIEDLLEPELYIDVVNGCYGLDGKNALTIEKLKAADQTTERLVKQAEAAFRVLPDIPMIDHFSPAMWLLKNPKHLDGKSLSVTKTLDRAERTFSIFNALL